MSWQRTHTSYNVTQEAKQVVALVLLLLIPMGVDTSLDLIVLGAPSCGVNVDLKPAPNVAMDRIQSRGPAELRLAFCPTEWACNATGERLALWLEEESASHLGTSPPALVQTVRLWREPLLPQPLHIDLLALDNAAKRRRQAGQLLIERVYQLQ